MLETNPIDGWTYLRRLRCNFTHLSLAVEQFEALRRAGGYKQKQWCIPEDANTTRVPNADSYEIQVDVGAGAVIWGYIFTGINEGDLISNYAYQVRDSCNDVALFSEPSTNQTSLWNGDHANGGGGQTLLSKLYVVGAPGLITVEIANGYPPTAGDQGPVQLIIFGGVPDRG
jgi:hypothetical protein